MPIWATGRAQVSPEMCSRQHGFTLMELLVVLLLVGLLVSQVDFSTADNPQAAQQRGVERLARQLEAQLMEAELTGVNFGLSFHQVDGGLHWQWWQWQTSGWQALREERWQQGQLPVVEGSLSLDGMPLVLPSQPPASPQLLVSSAGEINALELELRDEQGEIRNGLSVDPLARYQLWQTSRPVMPWEQADAR